MGVEMCGGGGGGGGGGKKEGRELERNPSQLWDNTTMMTMRSGGWDEGHQRTRMVFVIFSLP